VVGFKAIYAISAYHNQRYKFEYRTGEVHFQQYFSFIVAVRFIGGEIMITWRKPPT
jgi:hypothetical protein